MTKNQLIAAIKNLIKDKECENKTYYFGPNSVELWLYEDETKVPTKLIKVYIKKDVLYITTEDNVIGIDDEKVSEFDITEVKTFYDMIKNNK